MEQFWKLREAIVKEFGNYFEFSKIINEHESYISMVVRRRRELSSEKKERWAKVLKYKVEELF